MERRKRTKIVASVSDRRCEPEFIRELHVNGMDAVRINSAHITLESALKLVENIRRVSDKIPIILDTKGPEIRTTDCDEPFRVEKGREIQVVGDPDLKSSSFCIFVTYRLFGNDLAPGSSILIDGGELELRVESKDSNMLNCIALNDGVIGSRKSVNVPKSSFSLPSVSERDREFLKFAAENDIDFISHSFVRNRNDVLDVRAVLDEYDGKCKIIAKIENHEGVDNIDEILDEVYGVMVARGDLAIEMPFEKIPRIQKMIIDKCIRRRKLVIVATQMLHTMINSPRPTRAEVSDIAGAIYSNTDAVMLSGETTVGKYPVEAVRTIARVALEVEEDKDQYLEQPAGDFTGRVSAYLAKVAVKTSVNIGAKAIIADTKAGRTIRNMASYRGFRPIYAQCYSARTMRELALSYGVYASFRDEKKTVDQFLKRAVVDITDEYEMKGDDTLVILAGNFSKGSGFSFIEVGSVDYLREIALAGSVPEQGAGDSGG